MPKHYEYVPLPDDEPGDPALLVHLLRDVGLVVYWQMSIYTAAVLERSKLARPDIVLTPHKREYTVNYHTNKPMLYVQAGDSKYHAISLDGDEIILSGYGPFSLVDPDCFTALVTVLKRGNFDSKEWWRYVVKSNPRM